MHSYSPLDSIPHIFGRMHAPVHRRTCIQHIRTHTRSHAPSIPQQSFCCFFYLKYIKLKQKKKKKKKKKKKTYPHIRASIRPSKPALTNCDGKIFFAQVANSILKHMTRNSFFDLRLQKGFFAGSCWLSWALCSSVGSAARCKNTSTGNLCFLAWFTQRLWQCPSFLDTVCSATL